jgi:hypothetical protein
MIGKGDGSKDLEDLVLDYYLEGAAKVRAGSC